jgi:high-affinity Fe2+/Pb2+ permease
MMKKLEGRSWKHPGCALGMTAGLILGIVIAGLVAYLGIDFNILIMIWLGMIVVLGLIGWVIGDLISRPQLRKKDADPENGELQVEVEQKN